MGINIHTHFVKVLEFIDPVEQRTTEKCGFLVVRLDLQVGRNQGSCCQAHWFQLRMQLIVLGSAPLQQHCLNNFINKSIVKLKP